LIVSNDQRLRRQGTGIRNTAFVRVRAASTLQRVAQFHFDNAAGTQLEPRIGYKNFVRTDTDGNNTRISKAFLQVGETRHITRLRSFLDIKAIHRWLVMMQLTGQSRRAHASSRGAADRRCVTVKLARIIGLRQTALIARRSFHSLVRFSLFLTLFAFPQDYFHIVNLLVVDQL
jgi:hypothetical protein